MKALCAVDGSPYSIRGIEALGTLFGQSIQEVLLVHVMDTSLIGPVLKKGGGKNLRTPKILRSLETEGKNLLKTAHDQAARILSQKTGGPSIKIRPILAKGHPAFALIKQAEKRTPHLMILGSRGFHDIKDYLLGSVSRKVLSHAPCPVLMVKDPIQTPVRTVLAVDGSPASKRAANFVKSWLPPHSLSVHILSVVPKIQMGRGAQPYANALGEALQKQAQATTAQIRALLSKKKFKVTAKVIPGNPRTVILDSLIDRDAGLAVLGAKGLTGPERFQIGSVSEWVAAHAGCSILVVRPQPS